MEKRKKKSRIKYIGGANEIRRNRSPNRRNRSRRNRSRSPNRSNESRRNRSNRGNENSIWKDQPLGQYSQEPNGIPNRGRRGHGYLGRGTQNLSIKITNGIDDLFTYYVHATNETKIKDLKKKILNIPSIPSLNRQIKAMGFVWGKNCILRSSNNMMRLDNLDDNITLGKIDDGKKNNDISFILEGKWGMAKYYWVGLY